jgi:hypothetical protein
MAQQSITTSNDIFVRGSIDPFKAEFAKINDNFSELYAKGAGLGTSTRSGTATLVGGTVTVSDTAVTANSLVLVTCQTPGGTPGFLRVSARSAGASFTILSSSGTDTSVVGYVIVER